MKNYLFCVFYLVSVFLNTSIFGYDKPLKGTWDLKSKKLFDVVSYGAQPIAFPRIENIDLKGNLIVFDYKLLKNFLFSEKGKYIQSFGKKGEGPGEVKWQKMVFPTRDRIIISDYSRIHCFFDNYNYQKSIRLKRNHGRPVFFLDKDHFLSYISNNQFKINLVNLINMKTKTLYEDSGISEDVRVNSGSFRISIVVPPLTPRTCFTYDSETGYLYFGKNDFYMIKAMDSKGKIKKIFLLDRNKLKLTRNMKKVINKEMHLSKKMWKKLPDSLTYFSKIKIVNNMLYVFNTNFEEYFKEQKIDVFSLDGIYQYRISFKPIKDERMFGDIFLGNNFIYTVIQMDNGDMKISKYNIDLPTS